MSDQPIPITDSIDHIVTTYSHMIYRLAFSQTHNKSDADDIFQEVFLRYIKNKPDFETEEHRKAWLIRVTINCARKLWSTSWVKKTKLVSNDEIPFETEEDTNLHFELKKLPVQYRTVIHLFYYEDLSIEQISGILKRKPSTVRTQLTRARRKLKEILEEDYDV